jgi:hypothetical protein
VKRLLLVLALIPSLAFGFIDFYVQAGGDLRNSGSDTANAAKYTSVNGNWSTVTHIFTPTDGSNPVASGVAVNDYASIYVDGATTSTFIVRITNVVSAANGAITTSNSGLQAGTPPTTSATARTIKVGGAQKIPTSGPLGPLFSLATQGLAPSTDCTRINCKNDAVYTVTSSTNGASVSGPMARYQGYTSTPGDGGRVTVDGGTTGTSFILWSAPQNIELIDFTFRNNGATGFTPGVTFQSNSIIRRVAVHDVRGSGIQGFSAGLVFIECEAYNCNQANNVGEAGFKTTNGIISFYRCISHDNNNFGFSLHYAVNLHYCIADSNSADGIVINLGGSPTVIYHCDSYNNGGGGLVALPGGAGTDGFIMIENSNFIKNAGWGIDLKNGNAVLRTVSGFTDNLGFGSGTQANGSGTMTNMDHVAINEGTGAVTVTYGSGLTPYFAPATGDFRISLDAAHFAGIGFFLETQGGYTGSIGYPDIGAVQSKVGGGGTFPGTVETSAGVAQ